MNDFAHTAELVDLHNQMFVGKTMVRAELSANGEYTRWYFDDGSFWEWYTLLYRGTSEQVALPLVEGRLFKEEHDV